MEFQAELAQLLKQQTAILEKLSSTHTKTPAGAGNAVELHGLGSIFGSHSIEREVITAHVRPWGLGARLPKIPTVFAQPFFASLTGFTATVGDEPAYPCSDAPHGYMKGCDLSAQFGRVARDTNTIEINDVMLRKNRGDFTDLLLYGSVLGETGFTPGALTESDILNIVTKAEMVGAGVQIERAVSDHMWNGSPANNNAGGGYAEMPGLASQIATGQMDAHNGALCPALDSDVKDFGYDEIGGAGRDIVAYLSMLEAYLFFNAEHMGLLPWTAVLACRPELWYVLSEVWPCAYNTTRCAQVIRDVNGQVVVGGPDMVRLRDDMRQNMYIDINGRRYPVVTDPQIFEHTNITNGNLAAGEYASSIFFVPLTITGGFPVTYLEFLDYRAAAPDIALLKGTQQFWSDDGRYMWAIEYVKFCYKLTVKTQQRIILRTPQLAGRIDNVKYVPLQHFRSPDPDSPYFRDGGVSLRGDETIHAVWL
jgi:hypothetical protein